ncbi:tandem-95 repeat protein [Pseudoalteromonas sp. JBTF-M23]|uniref:Tandem-95 repeat protein n=1 Tax=Pseudoalteromonas caenipelagi TaxID=2726988 RepID=A0A849VIQ3_9GAMM|nr:tandem-95 repeat protein [Pseudoalteromonas caenipelagi]NOU52353.1 tandem-95 repeat protein [Pseudoalteromonas caenipelagi]
MSVKQMFNVLIVLIFALISLAGKAYAAQTISFENVGAMDSGGTGYRTVTGHSGYLVPNNLQDYGLSDTHGVNPYIIGSPQTFIFKADGSNVTHFDVTDIKIHAYSNVDIDLTNATQVVFKNASGDTLSTLQLSALTRLSKSSTAGLADLFGSFEPVAGVSSIEFTVHEFTNSNNIFNVSFIGLVVDNVNAQSDTTPPAVSSINLFGTPSAGSTSLTYRVVFDESATNISTDDFTLTTVSGNATGSIAFVSGDSGTSVDVVVSGISGVGSLRLDLKSNTNITDSLGNGNNTNGYVDSFNGAVHTVDRTPKVTYVTSQQEGTFKVGDTINISVNFDQSVLVTGAPTLTLETGTTDRTAAFANVSGSKVTFNYTVQPGDVSADLAYVSTSALALNSGTIKDSLGNAAILTLATPGTANSLSANKAIVIDGIVPSINVSGSSSANGGFGVSASGDLTLKFSETMKLGSSGTITLVDSNGNVIETFAVDSTQISLSGDTLTINPSADLSAGVSYAVRMDSGFLTDQNGNAFAGFSDNTGFTFTVAPTVELSVDNATISEKSGEATVTVALKDASGNAVTATNAVTVSLNTSGTATGAGTDYTLSDNISSGVTIAAGSSTRTFKVTAVDDSVIDDNETIVIDIASITTDNAVESGIQTVTITLDENDAPVFANLDGTPAFTENGSAVVLDSNVTVSDTELDALNNNSGSYDGASITIVRAGGANASDVFGSTGNLAELTQDQALAYNNTTVGTVTTNSAGSLKLTFNSSATTTVVNSVLQNITYTNSSEAPGTAATLAWTFNDGIANSSGTNQTVVAITPVNDAPTLDDTQTPVFTAIIEDISDANNTGVDIATLVVDNSIGDVDGSAVEAIAVVGVDNTNGVWQYSTDNGTHWLNLSDTTAQSVDLTTTARLLDGALTEANTHKIRFVANAHYHGSSSITFVAWDKSAGTAGDEVDATVKGGTAAFSAKSDVAAITVTSVNDAPQLATNAAITLAEGATTTITSAYLNEGDVDDSGAGLTYTITTAPANGSLFVDADNDDTLDAVELLTQNATFTQQDIDNGNLMYTHNSSDTTSDSFVFTLADGGEDNAAPLTGQTFNFTITPVNDPVSLTTPPTDISVTEDASSNLDLSALTLIDGDSGSVTVTISADKGKFATPADGSSGGVTATLSQDGKTITLVGSATAIDTYLNTAANIKYTGEENSQGDNQAIITITGNDGSGSVELAKVNVDITDVNDAPVINNLNGEQFDYNASAQSFVIVNQGSAATVTDIDTDTFNGGTLLVSIASGAQASEDVLAIDDSSAAIQLSGGQIVYNLSNVGTFSGGSNGSALTVNFNGNANNAVVAAIINAISYDNSQDSAGTAGNRVVRFALSDGEGGISANADVTINLTVNTAPTIVLGQLLDYTENDAATIIDSQATANDADGDANWQGNGAKLVASISANGLAEDILSINTNGDFSISNGQLSYQDTVVGTISETSGTANDGVVTGSDSLTVNLSAGSNAIVQALVRALSYENTSDNPSTTPRNVKVELTDTLAGSVSQSISIVVKAVNDAPTITGTPVVTVDQDQAYSFTPVGKDIDSKTLTYTLENNPKWLSINKSSGELNGTPRNVDVGTTKGIVVSVSDGELSAKLTAFDLTVININDAPTISGSPRTSVNERQLYTFTPKASDIDGDKLTFSIANKPAWLSLNTATGALSGTPVQSGVGTTNNIVLTVSDGKLQASLPAFSLTVINVNDAPTISGQPATSVVEGDSYSFTPIAQDIDSVNLTFSIENKPTWASFNPQTGELSGTPTGDDVGVTGNVSISVSDGQLSDSLKPFNLTVSVRNTAPKASPQTVKVDEDGRVVIKAQVSDEQGDKLALTVQKQPQSGALSSTESGWVYTPNANFNGQDSFAYLASDGELTSEIATVTVTVNPINDAPSAQDDNITLIKTADDSYTLAVLGNDADIDGDVLRVEGVTSSIGNATANGSTINYQAPEGYVGKVSFSYSVTDGNKGRANAKVDLEITGNRNTQAPTLNVPTDLTVNATGLFTKVNLGVASAKDAQGNILPVSLVDAKTVFSPGKHNVYWQTQDSGGLETIAQQVLNVKPLISLSKDQVVAEGSEVAVPVLLNGISPTYPLDIAYTIGGTASQSDHTALSGVVTINSGTQATINFTVLVDTIAEQEETVVVTLDPELNLGHKRQTVIRIRESNIAPTLSLNVQQQGETRMTVSQADGEVTINATADDANSTDKLTMSWLSDLSNISGDSTRFVFDPTAASLGVHAIKAIVTDNGAPAMNATETVYVEVIERLAGLSDVDTDGDLIPDSEEGYKDSDGDGIADYLDAIDECNVVPAQVNNQSAFLVEGDPGVCLRRGAVAALSNTGGLQLDSDEQQGIVRDTQARNSGGIFDYIAYGLPEQGQNYNLVLPQQLPIPANAVYRKYTQAKGWGEFVEDENNQVFSAAGEFGYCPPPGDAQWQAGLTEGHWCVQLVVQDGGPNDADGEANGTVVDPSGVAVYLSDNMQPVANEDSVNLPWNSSLEIDVLANDSDADNDTLALSQASAQFGMVEITAQQTLKYVAAEQFVGVDVVTYSISDGQGGTAHSQVIVEVVGNRAPVVQGEQITALHHKPIIIDVLANDSDPDGDSLSVSTVTANNGEVTIIDSSKLSYVSNIGFSGVDIVNYVVHDDQGAASEGLVQVQVTANRLPITQSDMAQLYVGESISIDVLANDSDADGDELTIVEASALQGSVSIQQGILLAYTAKAGFSGTDTVTYMLSDGYGEPVAGSVSVTVKAVAENSDGKGEANNHSKSSGGSLLWLYVFMLASLISRRSLRR